MSVQHQFKDEWLIRAADTLPGVTAAAVAELRGEKQPFLSLALLRGKLATPESLAAAVESVFRVPPAVIPEKDVQKLSLSMVPQRASERYQAIPLRLKDDVLELAMGNPLDMDTISYMQALSGRQIRPFYCLPDKLATLIADLYSTDAVVYDLVDKLDMREGELEFVDAETAPHAAESVDVHGPIIRLVNGLIAKAIRMGASDIHIEHGERNSEVRYRVDGILRVIMVLPKSIAAGPVVSRVKIMADLDLADHMRPQDGRAKLRASGQDIGLRVSTLPTSFGEKVVMRIIDPRAAEVPLEKMGFRSAQAATLQALAKSAQGVIVVTGPTGAGKTSTLYALLNKTKSPEVNIVTVEDPIEYRLEGINQVQVNEKQRLGFATALRSILRQDPDVILVGEMRDNETASVAFQAALTGHLVLTTLHTNDVFSAVARLSDMGLERFKIGPGLLAITAQRLVRRLCPACKKPVPPKETDAALVAAMKARKMPTEYWMATGCDKCAYSGYKGRLAILELLELDQELRDAITAGQGEAALKTLAIKNDKLYALVEDALWHLSQGETSAEEIFSYLTADLQAPAPAAAPAPAGGALRILVADDDPDIRVLLKKYLTGHGYEVAEAADGAKALEQISQREPDLLILDVQMPGQDGYEVITDIRKKLGLLSLPIVMLTALSDDKSQEKAMDLGADDYIVKPFKPGPLLSRVNALFRRNGKRPAA